MYCKYSLKFKTWTLLRGRVGLHRRRQNACSEAVSSNPRQLCLDLSWGVIVGLSSWCAMLPLLFILFHCGWCCSSQACSAMANLSVSPHLVAVWCFWGRLGETKRNLEAFLKEHQTTTRRGETDKSTIAEHVWEEQHQPQWNNIKIIHHARNENILLIKEALHIAMTDQQLLVGHCNV